jgi:hypothetical protein
LFLPPLLLFSGRRLFLPPPLVPSPSRSNFNRPRLHESGSSFFFLLMLGVQMVAGRTDGCGGAGVSGADGCGGLVSGADGRAGGLAGGADGWGGSLDSRDGERSELWVAFAMDCSIVSLLCFSRSLRNSLIPMDCFWSTMGCCFRTYA